ncbi:MAG: tripartite tricarboxylate transporter substrate binding protein, partial [Burkholderiales bacterium]
MRLTPILRFVAAITLSLTAACAFAQGTWPTKTVRLVLQFPPGGSTDVVARILAQAMTESLGQTVIVENKPGADGAIAAEYVARSEPDGHVFFIASNTPMMQVPLLKKNPPYDPIKSFTPVSLVGYYIYILVTNPGLPVMNTDELIASARANPGKLNYGSYSGVTQLMYSRLEKEKNIGMNVVNYKGEGPTVNDVLAGHIQLTFATPTSTLQHINENKLRPLAVLLPERYRLLPNVPTVTEAGLPNLGAETFAALYGPAKLPPEIAERM